MGIFKGRDKDAQQTSAAPSAAAGETADAPKQPAKLTPPFVPPGAATATALQGATAAGVLPPPAAPMYSMRPPESAARVEGGVESTLAESVRMAKEAQVSVQGGMRVAVQRARTATQSVARRPAERLAPASVGAYAPPAAAAAGSRGPRVRPRHQFDPVAATQAGLLNLAWRWQQAGSPIRAIHAYMQILIRYPGSPGADAAVADLVELSDKLAGTGQYHIALGIYDQLEELLA
jgi:hypothetical protein